MSIIFIVQAGVEYEGTTNIAAFTTREKADAHVAKLYRAKAAGEKRRQRNPEAWYKKPHPYASYDYFEVDQVRFHP